MKANTGHSDLQITRVGYGAWATADRLAIRLGSAGRQRLHRCHPSCAGTGVNWIDTAAAMAWALRRNRG